MIYCSVMIDVCITLYFNILPLFNCSDMTRCGKYDLYPYAPASLKIDVAYALTVLS
jgi:hypothetical protein